MKIRSKVFLIFILSNAFWLLLSLLLMQYLAKQDFQKYLDNKQSQYLESFVEFLAEADSEQLQPLTAKTLAEQQSRFHQEYSLPRHRMPKIILLDKDKRPVHGSSHSKNNHSKNLVAIALPSPRQKAAYLAMPMPRNMPEKAEARFLKQLSQNFVGIAIGLIIAAAIASLIMSRLLLKPIMAISKACEALKNKHWGHRINSKGGDELAVLSRNLDSLAGTLQASEAQQKTWLASTSHELKTPLAILQGEIEAMQDGIRSLDGEQLESLMHEVKHLQKLVSDLQASNQQLLTFDFEPLAPAAIIETQLQKFARAFAEKNISIETQLDSKIRLQADSQRLQQLFSNLLQNTLLYTNAGGQLLISMKETEKQVIIDWQDSTPAVSEAELNQLFDYFYRGESSRNRETGGSGLGLAIVKSIVTGHGGDISASLNSIGGLSLYITFNKML